MAELDERFQPVREIQQRVDKLEEIASTGAGGGSGMEPRVARLESDVENIKNNIGDIKLDIREIRKKTDLQFLITWGGLIAVALGLAGVMAKGFKWI